MTHPQEGLSQKITHIRKSMQMSLHDCAKLLGTSTERYLDFEQGEEVLSLPELEILACYFGIPLIECLEGQANSSLRFSLLEDNKRTAYIHLREKWIRSRIIQEAQEQNIELEELADVLGISLEVMNQYKDGEIPIPLDYLQGISAHFNIPLAEFLPEIEFRNLKDQVSYQQAAGQWNPEFPQGEEGSQNGEISYHQLLAALKEIPEEDQAQIAKTLLDKLKSI